MKSAYIRLLLLDMSKFKSVNRFTWNTHKKLKKCFGIEKDIGKISYSRLLMGLTVSMTFTVKSVRDIESNSFFELLHCYLITFSHMLLFLIVYSRYFLLIFLLLLHLPSNSLLTYFFSFFLLSL